MNPILQKIFDEGLVVTHDQIQVPLAFHLPIEECLLLSEWVTSSAPTKLVEIGFAYGISTLAICDAAHEVSSGLYTPIEYHVIDPYQEAHYENIGLENVARAGYSDMVNFHETFSEIWLPEQLKANLRIDFAFIDGHHTFDHALLDFFYINRMLEVGGIVVFDDISLPSISKLLGYVRTYGCFEELEVPHQLYSTSLKTRVRKLAGETVFRIAGFRKIAIDDRAWDWYKEF